MHEHLFLRISETDLFFLLVQGNIWYQQLFYHYWIIWLYMNAPGQFIIIFLNVYVYHSTLRFITGYSYQAHHCTLYDKAELPSLYTLSFNWHRFI